MHCGANLLTASQQVRKTQNAIKHVLTERYYAWEDAREMINDTPGYLISKTMLVWDEELQKKLTRRAKNQKQRLRAKQSRIRKQLAWKAEQAEQIQQKVAA